VSHSYTTLLYHVVFATKYREPWLDETLRLQVYERMGAILKDEGGMLLRINGMADHVHLLVRLRPDHRVSDILRDVKARSSGWIHRTRADLQHFWWQTGYGAFTVSDSQSWLIKQYIDNQQIHHRHATLEQEIRSLYRQHGIEVDERTIWD
jgi:putative transposase